MTKSNDVKSFTTVVTAQQLFGRGQVNNKWVSEPFKNLTFSTLIRFETLFSLHQNQLNFAVSLAVFKALKQYDIPNLKIKWPNDIMSANKKLCGILTENVVKGKKITSSIIGIGVNVNQEIFPAELTKAISMKTILKKEVSLELLLKDALEQLKKYIGFLEAKKFDLLEKQYLKNLYKKEVPAMFKNTDNTLFMGIIKGVSTNGSLQVALENSTVKEFKIKEITFM